MSEDIFRRLREGSPQPKPSSDYSFRGDSSSRPASPFSGRPGVTTSGTQQQQRTEQQRVVSIHRPDRRDDGDRASAYEHIDKEVKQHEEEKIKYLSRQGPENVREWEPPGLIDILKDLGLRMLEVGIAAAAYAVGEEIAYFFRRRRLYPTNRRT